MFVPNGFIPSNANRTREYDEEGRLRETRIGPGPHTDGDGGITESNSLFATDAEMFGAVTPFLKRNRIRDARRRNYVIQPGGACIYFEGERTLPDPYEEKARAEMPTEQESFGHNSQPGGWSQGPNQGRAFALGEVPSRASGK